MTRITSTRSTASLVVSVVALVMALGGTSYAVSQLPKNSVGSKQIKTGGVRSSEVKNGSLKATDFAPGTLLKGEQGEKGDKGAQGEPGLPGTPGASVGYARITSAGVVDAARSLNVEPGDVTRPEAGVICFNNLGFTPKGATATLEYASPDRVVQVQVLGNTAACPGTEQALVRVWDLSSSANVNAGFYIQFN